MVSINYALPAATASKRGGIEVGSGLSISGDVLSASGGAVTATLYPVASEIDALATVWTLAVAATPASGTYLLFAQIGIANQAGVTDMDAQAIITKDSTTYNDSVGITYSKGLADKKSPDGFNGWVQLVLGPLVITTDGSHVYRLAGVGSVDFSIFGTNAPTQATSYITLVKIA